jgi:L-lactate dehydrogenase complex protein LldG
MSTYHIPDNEPGFLRTVREALGVDTAEPRVKRDFPHIFASRDDRKLVQGITERRNLDYQGLISSFKENAAPLNLSVYIVENLSEAAEIILGIARTTAPEFGVTKHITQHAHPDIDALRLWEKFAEDPISVHTTYPEDNYVRDKTLSSFIGVTVADWGIAESATLVQLTQPDRPRSTSLVPSIHIGLLRKSRILANLTEAYSMLRREQKLDSLTLISGPSKTADIEAHMVHGAHGPREMHVIILDEILE